jgi:translation initiation factor 2 beta subunit (eIF-2beta)/eIF-5
VYDFLPNDEKESISYDALLKETIGLMGLVKSAVIYLVNFVNTEENKKKAGKVVLPGMIVDTSQFL